MKKKIVFVITKSELGGAQTWVNEHRKILEKDFDVFLITSESGWLSDKFNNDSVFFIPSIIKIFRLDSVFKISSILKKIKADVVISSSANAGLFSRLSKIIYKHKSIYVSHGWSCLYNGGRFVWLLCFIEKVLSLITDEILCVSKSDCEKAMSKIGIAKGKIKVIMNGITPLPNKEKVSDKKKILFVGRMTHPKRPDLLAEVVSNIPNVELYYVGGGVYLNSLKENFSSNPNIFFLGELNDFKSYYEYDVFVLSSDSEGLPMSGIEAGSAGLPIILSNVGGCPELIFNTEFGSNGLVFNNTYSELYSALCAVLKNYDRYYSSAQIAKSFFDINTRKDEIVKLLN
ncbi:glycosyltransferase [Pectobacterium brasiliense]|uniref:glycosyltransferase n=1 Tax=Pectobacterium brasiliense TaxID=180957 RepID=UPI003D9B9DB8